MALAAAPVSGFGGTTPTLRIPPHFGGALPIPRDWQPREEQTSQCHYVVSVHPLPRRDFGAEKPQNGTVGWSEAALGSPALHRLRRAASDGTAARQSTYSCFQANM